MGSASSKFRKHLQSGDEVQALQLYRNNGELRKALDPNNSYGDSHSHETPLHLASRHGMQTLLGIFLFSKGGNPNKTNARKETCLHNVCMENNWQSVHVCKRRSECLSYLLKWRGAKLGDSSLEKIDLAAQDEKQSTALHYAAASGLTQCVETLVTHGAPLFIENEDSLTPCDTAERNGHAQIALYLESKMVFSNDEEPREEEDDISMPPIEEYSGLRPQDLQEAKDQLLVETADMLSVPLFTAEALLRNHEWSREMLLEAWMTDPVLCCEKCGVTPPSTLFSEKPEVQENLASPLPSPLHAAPLPLDAECDICANTFLIADEPVHMTCTHRFCRDCWERYLNVKIQEGDAHHITCPAYDCTMLVPVDIIEGIVSRDMARRYLQFDIKAFVDSNPDMKWCPFPGCGRAVKLPELDTNRGAGNRNKIPSDTSRGVDCGVGHYFCWECLEESHEPCSCSNWNGWLGKISEIRPETLNGTEQETELAANCLWLVTNSKPCPSCKSPIQKNEGCNHMKCSKCKYDFCWVCLEQWKWHNSSTGGYFKCNRYEVVKKVEEQNTSLMNDAETKNKNMQELNRFVHYYTRFKNHENSFKLEEPLLKTTKDKMMKLAEAVTDNATAHAETKFVEEAVQQLLKARRVLKCSYVYGFYLEGHNVKKSVFEFMQTELEECTEILSQMVNRLYLRTPRRKIMDQAGVVQRKRHEFILAISKGLVPPETPPSARKGKKKRKLSGGPAVDEDLHRAIVASIQEVDPANPWIKDASGRHTNLVALLEWPSDDSSDDNGETLSEQRAKRESIGKCQRQSCTKVKARNPRTQGLHDYCSRVCMLVDNEANSDEKNVSQVSIDENMELLRALEMSRLQYLRDSGLLQDVDRPQKSSQSRSQKAKHRPRSNSAGQETKKKSHSGLSSIVELGIELQRFQELSSGFPKGGMDKDCGTSGTQPAGKSSSHRHPRKPSQYSRFEENKSTIVTRVPNKSVEDLYCLDPSLRGTVLDKVHGGLQATALTNPGMSMALRDSPPPAVRNSALMAARQAPMTMDTRSSPYSQHYAEWMTEEDVEGEGVFQMSPSGVLGADGVSAAGGGSSSSKLPAADSCGLFGSMFGAIKDLSVSNIHSSESDKTKDFLSKDLASIFSGWDLQDKDEEGDHESGDDTEVAMTASSGAGLMCFNNLSRPSGYSPKLSNVRDTGAQGLASAASSSSSSTKGTSSLIKRSLSSSSSGKALLKSDRGSGGRKSKLLASSREVSGEENASIDGCSSYAKKKLRHRSLDENSLTVTGGGAASASLDGLQTSEGERGTGNSNEDEVSLLKMAENLLQMTADVHSRMKAVEKGIRDLEGICDSDTRAKLKSSLGGYQFEKPTAVACLAERDPSSDTSPRKDDRGSKADADEGEQWYDVAEAFLPSFSETLTGHEPHAEAVQQPSGLMETASTSRCDDTSYAVRDSVISSSSACEGGIVTDFSPVSVDSQLYVSEQYECGEEVSGSSDESLKKTVLSLAPGGDKSNLCSENASTCVGGDNGDATQNNLSTAAASVAPVPNKAGLSLPLPWALSSTSHVPKEESCLTSPLSTDESPADARSSDLDGDTGTSPTSERDDADTSPREEEGSSSAAKKDESEYWDSVYV